MGEGGNDCVRNGKQMARAGTKIRDGRRDGNGGGQNEGSRVDSER
jgi:hypothetical protein